MSSDPQGLVDGSNLYAFARGSPLSRGDTTGRQSAATNEPQTSQVAAASLEASATASQTSSQTEKSPLLGLLAGSGEGLSLSGEGAALGTTGSAITLSAIAPPIAVAALIIGGIAGYKLHQAREGVAEAKRRQSQSQQQLDQTVETMWKNGLISYEEWLNYKATGNPPGVWSTEPLITARSRGSAGKNFMTMALRHITQELQKDPDYVSDFS